MRNAVQSEGSEPDYSTERSWWKWAMILILAVLLVVILRAALTAEPETPGAEASPAADRQYTTAP